VSEVRFSVASRSIPPGVRPNLQPSPLDRLMRDRRSQTGPAALASQTTGQNSRPEQPQCYMNCNRPFRQNLFTTLYLRTRCSILPSDPAIIFHEVFNTPFAQWDTVGLRDAVAVLARGGGFLIGPTSPIARMHFTDAYA
jgi:hypothetical protein